MEAAGNQQKDSVKVAVNIRPLITEELRDGCTNCATVAPGDPQDVDRAKSYILNIQQLEGDELMRQKFSPACRNDTPDQLVMENTSIFLNDLGSGCEVGTPDASSEIDEKEKEGEHSSIQDKLDKELQELDKRLQQKEAEMKRFAKSDASVLKQRNEKKLLELKQEKKSLQNAQKLKETYLHKLNTLESQVSELKKKQESQQHLLRKKQKNDDAAKRLQEEIHRIKSQQVQLQEKIKQEFEQFRSWKPAREKEVLELEKEGRRQEYEMRKLLALNQRQKMVLQRKTEAATAASERSKELLEANKFTRETYGGASGSGLQAMENAEAKTKRRKNWRRPTVQLSPSDTLQPSASVNTEVAPRYRGNIPLKLPRAMSSAAAETKPEEPVSCTNKDTGASNLRVAMENAEAKTKRRKKWRKPTVQLIPSPSDTLHLQPSASVNTEAAPRYRGNIPLKLPRAMQVLGRH